MASANFTPISPPKFSGENYMQWSIMMKTYLKAYDLWDVTEKGDDPSGLPANPTVVQLKNHSE